VGRIVGGLRGGWVEEGWVVEGWVEDGWVEEGWMEEEEKWDMLVCVSGGLRLSV